MDKIKVVELAVEGGGCTIFGQYSEGHWLFWEEGSSFGLGENDDEEVRSWKSEPTESLEEVLPTDWPYFNPVSVHPEFVSWFRVHFEPVAETSALVKERWWHVFEQRDSTAMSLGTLDL
jgi:hypothetical protein